MMDSATAWVEICTLLSDFACHSIDMRTLCFDQIDSGSAIDFIAVQTLDYKEQGKCRAGLEDDAPFAIAITAAMMSTLVLPVNVERDESKKGSSALGADDVRYAAMGVISFIPLFNWLVCSLASWRIFTLQLTLALFLLLPFVLYLLPYDLSSLICLYVNLGFCLVLGCLLKSFEWTLPHWLVLGVLEADLGICLAWYKQTTVSGLCHSILGTLLTVWSLALCSCSTKELVKLLSKVCSGLL